MTAVYLTGAVSLSAAVGLYVWSWRGDFVAPRVAAVPEPSIYAVFAGMAVWGAVVWMRVANKKSRRETEAAGSGSECPGFALESGGVPR